MNRLTSNHASDSFRTALFRGSCWLMRRCLLLLGCLLIANLGMAAASPMELARNHWAFQPVRRPSLQTDASGAGSNPIDLLIRRKQIQAGIQANPRADRLTLLRRVTFDLTGLPPSPDEVNQFLLDPSPEAYPRLVERLLASPRYGERWGRHWMDVARYADTAGDNADYPVPEARLYRDYIIDSFNADKPYDQFLQEQLAGDLLAEGRLDESGKEQVIATGFLALSRRYGTGPFELWHLTLENTIETVGQAFLGLNLKCARCHDHKFDPIGMKDYYGIYGLFASTEFPWAGSEEVQSKQFNRQKFVPLAGAEETARKMEAWTNRIQSLKQNLGTLEKKRPDLKTEADAWEKKISALKKEIRTLEKPGAPADLPVAYAVREGKPQDAPLQKRGDPATPGPIIQRCVPEAFAGKRPFRIPEGSSGRLEFARWLTEPDHPLTARVLVNRLWQYHFGRGLVLTPNNLGLLSEPPALPEVLDELAAQLVENKWSVKSLHRLILNSEAYQRSSADLPSSRTLDPSNRLHWRFERNRLDAESIRDAMLQVSGQLDLQRPGAHPFPGAENWTWTQHTPFKERYESRHRSVYLMTQRFQKHPFLALFDGPDTNLSTESRKDSTIPQQALFAMNNPFLEQQARALASRVSKEANSAEERLRLLYALTWNRPPRPEEESRTQAWLKRAEATAMSEGFHGEKASQEAWTLMSRVMLSANEFFYVD